MDGSDGGAARLRGRSAPVRPVTGKAIGGTTGTNTERCRPGRRCSAGDGCCGRDRRGRGGGHRAGPALLDPSAPVARRGPHRQHRPAAAPRDPVVPAAGRGAAALLRPAPLLDEGRSAARTSAVRSLSGVISVRHPAGGLAGRPAARRPDGGLGGAGAAGQRAVRHLLRHRGPDVLAGDAADRPAASWRSPGARAAAAGQPDRPGRGDGRPALHPVLGALPGRALGLWLLWQRLAGPARGGGPTPAGPSAPWWSAAWPSCPWVPTFFFQSRHTGTPWAGAGQLRRHHQRGDRLHRQPGDPDHDRLQPGPAARPRSTSSWPASASSAWPATAGTSTSTSAPARRPRAWPSSSSCTLAAAIAGGIVTKSAFSARYAAVVFIPLLILVALGHHRRLPTPGSGPSWWRSPWWPGWPAASRTSTTQRTQAPAVAAVLAAHGQAGRHRGLLPRPAGPGRLPPDRRRRGYDQITFPRGTGAGLRRLGRLQATWPRPANPAAVRQAARRPMAGRDHQIWLVWAPGYQGFGDKCEIAGRRPAARPRATAATNWVDPQPEPVLRADGPDPVHAAAAAPWP